MATVFDVAAAIREELGAVPSAMKLQKLLYYAQAWSLAWDDRPLFTDRIEAWSDGPVVREYWVTNRYSQMPAGDIDALSPSEHETIKAIVDYYARFDGEELSQMTHAEAPWLAARKACERGAPGREIITPEAMKSYYARAVTGPKEVPHAYRAGLQKLLALPPEALDLVHDLASEDADVSEDGEQFVRWLENGAVGPCPTG